MHDVILDPTTTLQYLLMFCDRIGDDQDYLMHIVPHTTALADGLYSDSD